jgi:hypothetical protein
MDNRQPNARALILFLVVGALENAEKLAVKSHIEADTVVLHAVDNLSRLGAAGDLNS